MFRLPVEMKNGVESDSEIEEMDWFQAGPQAKPIRGPSYFLSFVVVVGFLEFLGTEVAHSSERESQSQSVGWPFLGGPGYYD